MTDLAMLQNYAILGLMGCLCIVLALVADMLPEPV